MRQRNADKQASSICGTSSQHIGVSSTIQGRGPRPFFYKSSICFFSLMIWFHGVHVRRFSSFKEQQACAQHRLPGVLCVPSNSPGYFARNAERTSFRVSSVSLGGGPSHQDQSDGVHCWFELVPWQSARRRNNNRHQLSFASRCHGETAVGIRFRSDQEACLRLGR